MRRSFLAMFVLGAVACVEVPDTIHAQFAPPGATERSNYRPGNHGTAPPAFEPPAAKAAGQDVAADAGEVTAPRANDAADGGVS